MTPEKRLYLQKVRAVLVMTGLSIFVASTLYGCRSVKTVNKNTAVSDTQPATQKPSPKTLLPPADAWRSQESRDMGGALFIKPYLRQLLKDPDSLQDFEVVNATPVKRKPGVFKVTVFYRARNSFGALVPEQRTVTMVYDPNNDIRPWVLTK